MPPATSWAAAWGEQVTYFWWGIFWIGVYLILALFPTVVLLLAPIPGGNGFLFDLAAALGYAGTTMAAVMFFLTARFKRATLPFGIDIVYYFHRQIALVVFLFILLHPLLMASADPDMLRGLQPAAISFTMAAGVFSWLFFTMIIVTSLWRKQLGLHYDAWRYLHALLAVAALLLAIVHIGGAGLYIATPAKRLLWIAIVLSWVLLLAYVRIVKPFSLLKTPYRVADLQEERGNAWTLTVKPAGHKGLTFQPGQFVWLTAWSQPFAMKEHPFSIASSAQDPAALQFTIKELGDFTRRIKEMPRGLPVYVDGPYGAFSIDRHPAAHYVFLAGGIGIAPIMSMLRTLADRQDQSRQTLIYAYNRLEGLTFYEELERLPGRLALKVVYVLQSPTAAWRGERGFITEQILKTHLPATFADTECFVCGPVPMIRQAEKLLCGLGAPLAKIHSELFDLV